jgi:hypothetical protein
MRTKVILGSLLCLLMMSGCNGQTKSNDHSGSKKDAIVVNDSVNKPDIQVKVNKQYDKKGNVIRYDSTYSYVYSSPSGKMLHSGSDSIFEHFRTYFHSNYNSFLEPQLNRIFYNDSLFKYDFFNDDYFSKRYQLNDRLFERMYEQMDSLKKDFMDKNYSKEASKTKKK